MVTLHRGAIIRTNYGTGPYVVIGINGPCECPEFVRQLNGDSTTSEPHFHITCQAQERPEQGLYWLNGYRLDGTSVWGPDRIDVIGEAAQKDLFV